MTVFLSSDEGKHIRIKLFRILAFAFLSLFFTSLPLFSSVSAEESENVPVFTFSDGYPHAGQKVYFRLLNVDGGKAPYRINWSVDGKEFGRGKTAELLFRKEGRYVVRLAVSDNSGFKAVAERLFLVSRHPLTCRYGWQPEFPVRGQKVSLFLKELKGGVAPCEIEWLVNGEKIVKTVKTDGNESASFIFPDSDTAEVSLIVKSAGGEIRIYSSIISADENPMVYDYWWTVDRPIPGQNVRFGLKNLSGGKPPFVIEWFVNGNRIGSGEKIRYVFAESGKYILKVSVTDSTGRILSSEREFEVVKTQEQNPKGDNQ